jgi:hypothetical protein
VVPLDSSDVPIQTDVSVETGQQELSKSSGDMFEDFYVISEASRRNNAATVQLYGREGEIERCLMFLFGSDTFDASRVEVVSPAPPVFNLTNQAKFVAVCGNQGMGRGSVLNTIAHHVYSLSKMKSSYNVQLFKCHTNSYAQNSPFSAWKPVTQEMILRLYQDTKCSTAVDIAKGRRRSLVASVAAVNNELKLAVDHLFSTVLLEFTAFRPLVSFLAHVVEDKKAVVDLGLSDSDQREKVTEMIVALIQAHTKVSKKLAFITM